MSHDKIFDIEQLGCLAVFPLPSVVFFPDTVLPLHIFEPRYRQMVRDAVEGNRLIAMALIDSREGLDEAGRPRLNGVIGVGELIHHQELEDGRYNILLEGVAKARIVRELESDTLYRQVEAELIEDEVKRPQEVHALLQTLNGCIVGLQQRNEKLADALAKTISNASNAGAIANTLSSVIFPDLYDRQELLEEVVIDTRLDRVVSRVTDLLALARVQSNDSEPLN